ARTAELFYFVVESARRSGAATSVHLLRGDAARAIPTDLVSTHRWFGELDGMPASDPAAPPDVSRVPFRGNTIRVLVSDLLFPGNPDPALRLLASRQGSPIILVPYLVQEAAPDWAGNYEFVDAERRTHHPHRIEPSILDRKSTRLNSSHVKISYAVFCLKKKMKH